MKRDCPRMRLRSSGFSIRTEENSTPTPLSGGSSWRLDRGGGAERQGGVVARFVELRRHTDNDGDVLTAEGVRAALDIGRRPSGDYHVLVSTGAQRATHTLACFLAALGPRGPATDDEANPGLDGVANCRSVGRRGAAPPLAFGRARRPPLRPLRRAVERRARGCAGRRGGGF